MGTCSLVTVVLCAQMVYLTDAAPAKVPLYKHPALVHMLQENNRLRRDGIAAPEDVTRADCGSSGSRLVYGSYRQLQSLQQRRPRRSCSASRLPRFGWREYRLGPIDRERRISKLASQ